MVEIISGERNITYTFHVNCVKYILLSILFVPNDPQWSIGPQLHHAIGPGSAGRPSPVGIAKYIILFICIFSPAYLLLALLFHALK